MTNGENLKNIYPDLEIIGEIKDVYVIMLETYNVLSPKLEVFKSWWNAEYKEPSSSENLNKSENPTSSTTDVSKINVGKIEPTTENDLGIEKIIDEIEKEFEKVDIPIMDKLTIFAKVQNALYKYAINNNSLRMIRPKGHWIDKFGGVYRCSYCREVISIDTEIEFPNGITYKYCPYCGSKNSVKIADELAEELEQIKGATKNDLGVDCIVDVLGSYTDLDIPYKREIAENILAKLPSVTPQEPRMGHWIMTSDYLTTAYGSIDYVKCSCCGEDSLEEGDFCPNCGVRMVEPQESEDKE